MANKYEELLSNLELRTRQLMFLCDSLREENAEMKILLSEKESSIDDLNSRLEQLKSKYDSLVFAKAFSSQDATENKNAKAKLSKLVQEIDKCIALLKN